MSDWELFWSVARTMVTMWWPLLVTVAVLAAGLYVWELRNR